MASFVSEPLQALGLLMVHDRRPVDKKPKKIFLIRHPHTNEEDDGIYRGDHAEITEKGWDQARVVADRMAQIGITHIVTSTLPRSRKLAEVIASRCAIAAAPRSVPKVIPSDLFVECRKPSITLDKKRDDPGSVEVMHDLRRYFDFHYRHSDEENRWRLERRAWQALRMLAELDAECVAVVTHGKFLRVLIHFLYEGGTLHGFYGKADRLLKHDHTGITILSLEPSFRTRVVQWNIVSMNDIAHTEEFVSPEVYRVLAMRT